MPEPKQPWARPSPGRPAPPGVPSSSRITPQPPAPPSDQRQPVVPASPPTPRVSSASSPQVASRPQSPQPDAPRQKIKKSSSVPLKLIAVSLVVALAVFLGLRSIRVAVSENQTGSQLTPSDNQAEESIISGNESGSGTATTVADSSDPAANDKPDWNELARSIVFFEVAGSCGWNGSGTLILDGSYILTNWHVSGSGECPLRVGLTENFSTPPNEFYPARVVAWDSQIDLAIVRLLGVDGKPYSPPGRNPIPFALQEVNLGEPIKLLGYPGYRDDVYRYTLTLTDGVVSGTEDFGEPANYNPSRADEASDSYRLWGEYLKHTADQNPGVSGGAALNSRGELVAVPTAGFYSQKNLELPGLELMRSISFVKKLVERVK